MKVELGWKGEEGWRGRGRAGISHSRMEEMLSVLPTSEGTCNNWEITCDGLWKTRGGAFRIRIRVIIVILNIITSTKTIMITIIYPRCTQDTARARNHADEYHQAHDPQRAEEHNHADDYKLS